MQREEDKLVDYETGIRILVNAVIFPEMEALFLTYIFNDICTSFSYV